MKNTTYDMYLCVKLIFADMSINAGFTTEVACGDNTTFREVLS